MKDSIAHRSPATPQHTRKRWRALALLLGVGLTFLIVTTASAVPNLIVTLADAFIGGDGDGRADPGETIEYTAIISNTGAGATDATGVAFSDTIDPNTTLVGGSETASPVGVNDTFPVTVVGNVSIDSGALAAPFSVTTNDFLGLNPTATISAFDATTVNGGTVSMTTSGANIGRFTYNPPAGFEGTDSFTYTLSDNSGAPSAVANRTATVSITVSGMVWFINNNAPACTVAGCGRLSNPFSTLAAFNTLNNGTGNNPAANDNIFVFESATQYTGAVTLLTGQRLIGQDATQSLSAITGLNPPTGSVTLPGMNSGNGTVTSLANTVTLNTNATVRGLSISSTTSTGMTDPAAAITGVSVSEVNITTTTGTGVNFTGTAGTLSFTGLTTTGGAGANLVGNPSGTFMFSSVSVNSGANPAFTATGGGTINVTGSGNTINTTTGQAVVMDGVIVGSSNITFATIGVSGSPTSADALSFTTVGGSGNTFNGGNVTVAGTTTGGDGIDINGSAATFSFSSATIDNTAGAGINLSGANGPVTFTTVDIDGTTGAGIDIASNTNTVNINGGTIGATNDPAGNVVDVNAGSANITIAAPLTKSTTNRIAEVTGRTAGTVDMTGSLNCSSGCTGINVVNNTGGTINFSNGTKNLNTGTNTAVTLSTNTGATINFTGGGLNIDTTTGNGFNASGGGTVSVTGSTNTIDSGAATTAALRVDNTTIGSSGLTFQRISANGAPSGIVLNATGSSGGLTVTGNGGTCSTAGTCTGGAIQNTTSDGLALTNTRNVLLTRIYIANTGGHGVNGTQMSDASGGALPTFAFMNGFMESPGNADNESALFFDTLGATNITGRMDVSDSTIQNFEDVGVHVGNQSGILTVNVTNVTINNNSDVNGEEGIDIFAEGTATININISNSRFQDLEGGSMNIVSQMSGTIDLNVDNIVDIGTGGPDNFPTPPAMTFSSEGTSSNFFVDLTNNRIVDASGDGIFIGHEGEISGRITGNVITGIATGDGIRIDTDADGNQTATILIQNNQIGTAFTFESVNYSGVGDDGIQVLHRDGTKTLNLTIDNNQIANTSVPNTGEGLRYFSDDDVAGGGAPANLLRVTGNTFTNIGVSDAIVVISQDTATNVCTHISGNTFVGANRNIFVQQSASAVLQITQASMAALASANTNATSSPSGTITFNGTCTTPPLPTHANHVSGNQFFAQSPAAPNTANVQASAPNQKPAARFDTPQIDPAGFKYTAYTFTKDSATQASGTPDYIRSRVPFTLLPPAAPMAAGETVNVNIGSLPAGKAVTIRFRVTINNPLPQNATRILNQGSVSGSNFSTITTSEAPADTNPQCTAAPPIGTATCTPVDLVDLSVFKNNTTSNTIVLGNSFTWQIQVSNTATSRTAVFTSGQIVLEDHLPGAATYGTVSVGPSGGLIGTVSCSITSNVLTCAADPGGLSIPPGEGFAAGFATTPTASGALVNPTGGVCRADPNALFAEVSTANNSCSNTVTVTRPDTTVTSITRQSANPNRNASVTWQVVFANPISGLTASNFTLVEGGSVNGATITGVTETSGPPATTWNITANAGSGDGTLELRMANDTGLSHNVTNQPYTEPVGGAVYTIDKTAPTVTGVSATTSGCLGTSPERCNAPDVISVQVTFSEVVNVTGTPQLTLETGATDRTADYASGSGTSTLTFNYTVQPGDTTTDLDYTSTAALTFNGGNIEDAATNSAILTLPAPGAAGSLGANEAIVVDTTAPVATNFNRLNPATTPTNADTLVLQAIFSEDVTGVDGADFTVPALTGETIGIGPVSASVYDLTISGGDLPGFNGLVDLDFASSPTIADLAGNPLTSTVVGFDQHYVMDNVGPTVSMSSAAPDPTNTTPIPVTVTFSESVTGFIAADITTGNGTVSNFAGSGATYTFDLVPTGQGLVTANIAAGVAQDAIGNGNTAATQFSRTYDSIGPTVSMTSTATDPTGTAPIAVTVQFSEAVTGFSAADIAPLVNGAVSNFVAVDGDTYSFDLTPAGDGAVTADIAAGVAQDAAGNPNAAATQFSRLFDTVDPTVTIDQATGQTDPTSASPINFTVTFSEDVTDFDDPADVTLSGTAGATSFTITGGPRIYTVAVSGMTTNGTVIASVPAAVAQDLAGRSNTASTPMDDTITFIPPVDLSITKTDGVTTATPGGSVTYTITASNAGPNADPAATVADTLPAGLTATWTCVGAGGGTCTASGSGNINDSANLPVGGSVTYTVSALVSPAATGTLANTATVSAGAGVADTVPANNSATDTDTLAVQADLAITKTDGVTTATPGGSVTYTITASNAGPSDAPAVSVADTFPASLTATWTCVGAGGGTCTASGSGNINDSASLPAGGSVTYTVSATINGAATGTLSNTATVSSVVTDPNPANNSATDTDTLAAQADLVITKTDGVTTATPGGSVTYTITASNAGPSNAPGASVADTFPASLTATWTCVGAGGGTCTAGPVAGNISDIVNLPAGGSVTYTVSATISAAATGSLSNTATVAAPAGVTDPDPANNSATDSDALAAQADLSITKTDGVTSALAGGSVTYTITASNSGPSDASGATVADTFPTSLTATWTCVGAGGGTCTAAGSGDINDIVNLPAGGSVTYTASANVSISAVGSLSNTATVAAPAGTTDPDPANNSATDTDTLVPPVAVTINQASGQADPTNGGTINFTVVFASPVTDFDDAADVTLGGTAGATTVNITGGPATYNVAVSGMTTDGSVTASIPAGVAIDAQGQSNAASTSTDNTVIYDTTAPTVTINQGPTQSDPTGTSPITFGVVFSEPVTGFDGTDVVLSGTAGATSAIQIDMTLDGTAYNIAVSGMTSAGTVIADIPVGAAQDAAGNDNSASTSTDNTVTFAPAAPVVTGIVRADPDPTNASTLDFTVTFSSAVSGVDVGDFSLVPSGVTGATITGLTGSGTTWTVTVGSGSGSGTLGLNLVDDDTIVDTFGTPLGGTGPGNADFTGETYTVDRIAPTAGSLATPPAQSGSTSYSFTVVFSDNLALDIASLDGSDIRVSGPGGFSQLATLVSVSPATNGTPRTATYQITPPGGAWDVSDGGSYTVALEAGQVFDTAGNPAVATPLGSFQVSLSYTIYLPLVAREGTPDLVASVSISPNKSAFTAGEPVTISVTVTNQGNGAAAPFWVDLYLNPSSPPAVNQPWNTLCGIAPCFGIAWDVPGGLAPGQSVTLTSQSLAGGFSIWPGWFAAGTSDLYVYVDSFNPGAAAGAVAESNEANNRAELHGLSVTGTNPLAARLRSAVNIPTRPAHRVK